MLFPLALLALAPTPSAAPPTPALSACADEYAERLRAAGDDVARLWELSLWCEAQEREGDARGAWERILELDAAHRGAHEKLCHHFYSEQWFATYRALSTFRRAEDRRMLERGLVRHGSDWVPAAELPFIRMQWVRAASGTWSHPAALERARRDGELAAAGWQQQDLVWVPPDDFDKWRSGLWKCGAEWLDTPAANAYHAELGRWWEVPGEHFVALSTCEREALRWITWWADQTYQDLVRAVGVKPAERPRFVVLRSVDQYNDFAAGSTSAQRPATEAAGWSSVHYAYLADSWVDLATGEFQGSGVCYWDAQNEALAPFGQHAVRHAAAQSYLELVDPSWGAVGAMIAGPAGTPVDHAAFWGEKRLPRWFRYGVAAYVERYFHDASVGAEGDPWWARAWSLANLRNAGGLPGLDEVFACELDPNDPAHSARRISAAGLVVSFVLDGECQPVKASHSALKLALMNRSDAAAAARALEQALRANEPALRAYAQR